MYGLLSFLIPAAVIGGIVYFVVRVVGGRTRQPVRETDEGSVRRLFVYTMLFVALIVAVVGLQGLLGRVLSTATVRSDEDLATTLALTLVGLPDPAAAHPPRRAQVSHSPFHAAARVDRSPF